jgi:hypothetical protein
MMVVLEIGKEKVYRGEENINEETWQNKKINTCPREWRSHMDYF